MLLVVERFDVRYSRNASAGSPWRTCWRLVALWAATCCTLLFGGADQLAQRAVQLLQTGKPDEAIVELRKVLSHSPDYFPAYSLLGVSYSQLGKPEEARVYFEKAVELAPQSTQARNNLGANYLALGKSAEAAAQFKKVLSVDPANVSALVNLAHSEMALGNPRQALEFLERAWKLAPQDLDVQIGLAEARFKNGQSDAAVEQIKRLSQSGQASDPRISVALGLLLERNGYSAEASPLLVRAGSSGPEGAHNMLALAQRNMDEGDYKTALALSLAIEDSYKTSASWHEMVGYAYFKLDQAEPALEHLQTAIRLDPANEDYYLTLAEFLGTNNALPALVAVFESAVKALPHSLKMQSALGVTYLMARDFEKAEAVLKRVIEAHPGYEIGYKLLADCYHREKDWANLKEVAAQLRQVNEKNSLGWYFAAEAEYWQSASQRTESLKLVQEYIEKAIGLDPQDWRPRALLGKVLLQENRLTEAATALEKAVALQGVEPSLHYLLATTLRKLGKADESKQAFKAFEEAQADEKAREFRQLLVDIQ